MKLDNPIHEIREQMELRGGSFVQQLSKLMRYADKENLACLLAAFPRIMETYDGFASLEARARLENIH